MRQLVYDAVFIGIMLVAASLTFVFGRPRRDRA